MRSERTARTGLTLSITGAVVLGFAGSIVANQGRVRFGGTDPGNPTLRSIGAALLIGALVLVFTALTFIPSTERELRRKIDLEASSITLGTCLVLFWLYPAIEAALPLPSFSSGVAALSVLSLYILSRAALAIRYR